MIIKQADIDFAKIEGKNLAISVVDSQRYSNVSGSGSASYSECFESSQKTCRVQLSYINILFSRRLVVTNDNLRGLVNFQIQIQFRKQMIGAHESMQNPHPQNQPETKGKRANNG